MPLSKLHARSRQRTACDLDTAEGRAHMASNARAAVEPAMPEGALKRQLLAEIADHGADRQPGTASAVVALASTGYKKSYKNNSSSRTSPVG